MKEIKEVLDKVLDNFSLSVGGSHSTSMYSADEAIILLEESISEIIKEMKKEDDKPPMLKLA